MDVKQAIDQLDNLIYRHSGLVHGERAAWDKIRWIALAQSAANSPAERPPNSESAPPHVHHGPLVHEGEAHCVVCSEVYKV